MKRSCKFFIFRNSIYQSSDVFTDNLKIVRSHIPTAKMPARIDINEEEKDHKVPRIKSLVRGELLDHLRQYPHRKVSSWPYPLPFQKLLKS